MAHSRCSKDVCWTNVFGLSWIAMEKVFWTWCVWYILYMWSLGILKVELGKLYRTSVYCSVELLSFQDQRWCVCVCLVFLEQGSGSALWEQIIWDGHPKRVRRCQPICHISSSPGLGLLRFLIHASQAYILWGTAFIFHLLQVACLYNLSRKNVLRKRMIYFKFSKWISLYGVY